MLGDPLAQGRINAGLPALAGGAEVSQHLGRQPEGDALLGRRFLLAALTDTAFGRQRRADGVRAAFVNHDCVIPECLDRDWIVGIIRTLGIIRHSK